MKLEIEKLPFDEIVFELDDCCVKIRFKKEGELIMKVDHDACIDWKDSVHFMVDGYILGHQSGPKSKNKTDHIVKNGFDTLPDDYELGDY